MDFVKNISVLVIRIIIGALFIWAGIKKIEGINAFTDNIAAFEILPTAVISPLALILPVFEVSIGMLLIFGPPIRMAALAVIGMSLVFLVALSVALFRGLDIDCGCFGGGEEKGQAAIIKAIIRDILLIAGGLIVWLTRRNECRVFANENSNP